MNDEFEYDVFLSHNSKDKQVVEESARRPKREAELNPFLDKFPGEPWQEALEHALNRSRTCVVFIGPDGLSPWEQEEKRSALKRQVEQTEHELQRRIR